MRYQTRPIVLTILLGMMVVQLPAATGRGEPVQEQVDKFLKVVKGKRIAFLTNPAGVDSNYVQLADLAAKVPGTTITAFFSPEHGLRGDHQAGLGDSDYLDPITSVPVYAVYGKRKAPEPQHLAGTDILVIDIQDVGVRFYTFPWTMTYAMEAAAKCKVKVVVFDRPNPINAIDVQGAANTEDAGLVGRVWPGQRLGMATRHGMTVGEMASMVNGEWLNPKADLEVITMPVYDRSHFFEQTGYPWVFPSPNMPTVDTAVVYPGTCVFEGTNISEGRGTTRPFEIVGAPFIDGTRLAAGMNALELPGVRFRPAYFTPSFGKYKEKLCGGVQLHVTDRKTFEPIRAAVHLLSQMCQLYPSQVEVKSYASKLMGDPEFGKRIRESKPDQIIADWSSTNMQFKKIRAKYLLYQPERNGL